MKRHNIFLTIPPGNFIEGSLRFIYNYFQTKEGDISDYVEIKFPTYERLCPSFNQFQQEVIQSIINPEGWVSKNITIVIWDGNNNGYELPLSKKNRTPLITLEQFLKPSLGKTKITLSQAVNIIIKNLECEINGNDLPKQKLKAAWKTNITYNLRYAIICFNTDTIHQQIISRMHHLSDDLNIITQLKCIDNILFLYIFNKNEIYNNK